MRNISTRLARLARHQTKLWIAAVAIAAIVCMNLAAGPPLAPGQWEYRIVVFKVEQGEQVATLQTQFEGVLNREAANGWEFDGRCARLSDDHFGIDYLVLRRRVR